MFRSFGYYFGVTLAILFFIECGGATYKSASRGGFAREERSVALADRAPEAPRAEAADYSKSRKKRLVVYNSTMKVQVARVESALSQVKTIAEKHGGFIEKSATAEYNSRATVRLRVAVENFYKAVRELGALGTVLKKDINADDITREFQDSNLRLNSARRLRERLYVLLKSDVKQKEKIKILKEISRLNEEIETLEGRIKAMSRRAALATITLQLESLLDPARAPQVASPFPWVAQLKPGARSIKDIAPLEYKAPAGFFEDRDKFADGEAGYLLLSPDGVKVRSGRLENYPKGPAAFWVTVLKGEWERRGYKLLHERGLPGGGRAFYLNVDDGLRSSFYVVALFASGDWIDLVEIDFPDEEIFKKRRPGIDEFLDSIRVLTWQNFWSYFFY